MSALRRSLATTRRLRKDEEGTTLVEFAIVIALFLLIFFMLLDFGRMSYNWVMAEKAVQMAARIAAVRPAACAGVPEFHQTGGTTARYGVMCNSGATVCQSVTVTCSGALTNPTVAEIWARVEDLLPSFATPGNELTPANLRFQYSVPSATAERMGFLGGPFTPVVTVEIQNVEFEFVSPLAGLARLAGAADTSAQEARETNGIPMPSMSVSLPGEDLALGENG